MKVITTDQMKKYDKKTIEELGISSLVLMERASFGVFDWIKKNLSSNLKNKEILIIAGVGNNGGDALVLARMLFLKNFNIKVVFIGDLEKRSLENKIQYEILEKLGIKIFSFEEIKDFYNTYLIIDGLFGVGLTRDLNEKYIGIIKKLNTIECIKIALDIPTGINGDTGKIMGEAFRADYTFTFAFYKLGLFSDIALDYVGKIILVDIGIPQFFANEVNTSYLLKEKILPLIKKRNFNSYKNQFGRVLLIGGSESMSGALILATKSALRSGVGLVNLLVEKSIHTIVASQVPSAMTNYYESLEDFKEKFIKLGKLDSVVFGTGCGINSEKKAILEFLIENYQGNLIIDADGLNILSENLDILSNRIYPTIITPHLGEFARLTKKTSKEINENKLEILKIFMKNKNNFITILKGAKSIITNGQEYYINSTGNPIFARGGSGDILSGLIGGLSAYNNILEASLIGTFIHGLAGDLALEAFNEISILPEELTVYISKAFKNLDS